jgi:hypothetical protein
VISAVYVLKFALSTEFFFTFCSNLEEVTSYALNLSLPCSLHRHTTDHLVILDIFQQMSAVFCLILGHTGLSGKMAADAAAKEAILLGFLTSN